MATSIHSGVVEFGATLFGTDDDPVDTVIMRDGVANNVLHAADSYAQVRVNVAFPDGSTFASNVWEFGDVPPTGYAANQWYRIGGGPLGEWPLTIHADGTPYKMRIRVGLTTTSAGSSTQTVRVVVCPTSLAASERDLEEDHIWEASFNSSTVGTTPAWITGTSQGSVASQTMLTLSNEKAAAWIRNVSVYDAVSSPPSRNIQQCVVAAHVFAKSSSASIYSRLHNLLIAEYVGL